MIVFLDTEFTDLLAPELLSVGLVTLDGRELYCELDIESEAGKGRIHHASGFVKFEGVRSQWGRIPNAACTAFDMGQRVAEWLIELAAESQNPIEKIEIGSDVMKDSSDQDASSSRTRMSNLPSDPSSSAGALSLSV